MCVKFSHTRQYTNFYRYLEDYENSVLPAMLSTDEGNDTTGKRKTDGTTNLVVLNTEKDLNALAEKVSSHPLMTYRLIRRYTKELVDFERNMRKDYDKRTWKEVSLARISVTVVTFYV